MANLQNNGYENPDVLVSTEWAAEHISDPKVRIVDCRLE